MPHLRGGLVRRRALEGSEVAPPVPVHDQLAIQHRSGRELRGDGRSDLREVRGERALSARPQRHLAVDAVEGQAAMS